MRLSFTSILFMFLAATTQVMATTFVLEAQIFTIPVYTGTLITDDGHQHNIGSANGCHTNGLGFVKEFCLDTDNLRAHIYWTNQPGRKYCFRQTKTVRKTGTGESCYRGICPTLWTWTYTEAPCTW